MLVGLDWYGHHQMKSVWTTTTKKYEYLSSQLSQVFTTRTIIHIKLSKSLLAITSTPKTLELQLQHKLKGKGIRGIFTFIQIYLTPSYPDCLSIFYNDFLSAFHNTAWGCTSFPLLSPFHPSILKSNFISPSPLGIAFPCSSHNARSRKDTLPSQSTRIIVCRWVP